MKLASVSDIPEGGSIVVMAGEEEVALFKINGRIFALKNECPHMGGPLGEGELEGNCITCPWHGWQFDVPTGGCHNMPGQDAEKLPIEIKDNDVYLLSEI